MPDYSKGQIYTIRCKYDTTLIYVGSTINPLYKRLGSHKGDSKSRKSKLYTVINNDWENWYIELYELYPCVNVEELTKREGEIIRLISNLNERIAGRSNKEWRQDNAEYVKERKKEHYEQNKDRLSIESKKRYSDNPEKKLKQSAKYRENNKEKMTEQKRKYRLENADKLNERKREKIPCDKCGKISSRCHTSRHQKTIKCMNFTPE